MTHNTDIKHSVLIKSLVAAGTLLASQAGFADLRIYEGGNGVPMISNSNIQSATTYILNNTNNSNRLNNNRTSFSGTSSAIPYVPNPDAPNNINYSLNRIENVNAQTLGSLGKKWRDPNQPIVVAHFGDSHVQLGWKIAPIRRELQQVRGDGGRGMIFPYSTAKTYSQEDFTSSSSGNWITANSIQQPPKMAVGISGFVAKTSDNFAQVNFDFSKADNDIGSTQAKVNYRVVGGDYNVTVSNGNKTETQRATVLPSGGLGQLVFNMPNTKRDLRVSVEKLGSSNSSFELHGVDLEKPNSNGLTYHNLGVGGAVYQSLLQQTFFEDQFPQLNADLVILDWGTNDLIYTNAIPSGFEDMVRSTIRRVRNSNPNAAILLTSVQEARRKGKNISVSAQYADMMRRIAKEENTLFYDWYNISGGSGSVALWREYGFASKDTIHLNGKGYRIQGGMFANALRNALN